MESLEFKAPELQFFNSRLDTFESWSSQIQPDKFDLSSAGFYYTGRGDIVKCFSCDLRLSHWKKEDNAMKQHEINSPNCIFLKVIGFTSNNSQKFSKDSTWDPWTGSLPWC